MAIVPLGTSESGVSSRSKLNTVIGYANDLVAAEGYGFRLPVLYDPQGAHGQQRTVYVPRASYFKQGTKLIDLSAGAGTPSVWNADYVALQHASLSTMAVAYIDAGDLSEPYKVVNIGSLPGNTDNLIPIATLWQGQVFACPHRWQLADGGRPLPYSFWPFVIDGGVLRVPTALVQTDLGTSTMTASSQFYKAIAWPPGSPSTAHILYFDVRAFAAGNDPWVTAARTRVPSSSWAVPVLAWYRDQTYNLAGVPLVGNVPGGLTRNIVPADPAAVDLVFTGAVETTISHAALVARGLTKGMRHASSGFVYCGGKLFDASPGQIVEVTVYVESNTPGQFGTPKLFVATPSLSGNLSGVLSLIEDLGLDAGSGRYARRYKGWVAIPADKIYSGVIAGTDSYSTADVRICGVQVGVGEARKWIRTDDYPTPTQSTGRQLVDMAALTGRVAGKDLLYGSDMWLVAGRPQTLYMHGLFADRVEGNGWRLTWSSRNPANGYLPQVSVCGGSGCIEIDPDACGDQGRITCRPLTGTGNRREVIDVTTHVAPADALDGTSLKVMCIGDSLIDGSGLPAALRDKMLHFGATSVETIGLLVQAEAGGSRSARGFGVGGSALEDEVYLKTDERQPVPAGSEASYLSGGLGARRTRNTFLRAEVGSEAAARNGYVWDFKWGIDRFSATGEAMAYPDYLVINYGTNDTDVDEVEDGIRLMMASIRAEFPTLPVAWIVNPLPRSENGDARWASWQVPLIRRFRAVIDDLRDDGDDHVHLLYASAHASSDADWTLNAGTTDPASGQTSTTLADVLHYRLSTMEQVAELVAAWVACIELGA